MRIFVIKDDNLPDKELGYLFYYEGTKAFYIELPENAEEWETPLILSSCVKKKEFTVCEEVSRLWVRQRIVPMERQNLGFILRDNRLNEYDEFKLLMLSNGRCEQDDCYLKEIKENELPEEIAHRCGQCIKDCVVLSNLEGCAKLLITFEDDTAKLCRIKEYAKMFLGREPSISSGGRFLNNGNEEILSSKWLYENGEQIGLSASELQYVAAKSLVTTEEARNLLGCSRQNLEDMVKKNRLHPIDMISKSRIYARSETTKNVWG